MAESIRPRRGGDLRCHGRTLTQVSGFMVKKEDWLAINVQLSPNHHHIGTEIRRGTGCLWPSKMYRFSPGMVNLPCFFPFRAFEGLTVISMA